MSIKEVNHKISLFGIGLLARIKYGIFHSYSQYDFMAALDKKKQLLENQTYSTLYKKLPK